MNNFEYKTEKLAVGRRAAAELRYPVGEPFGEFYAELSAKCAEFARREYAEYSGRGLTYRAYFDVVCSGGGKTSVVCTVTEREKGEKSFKKHIFSQIWLDDGRILPIYRCFGKKLRKNGFYISDEFCVLENEIIAVGKLGEKIKTDVFFGNFTL